MALSECTLAVDEHGRELTAHGTADFPIACYHDDFRICDVDWHWHEEWEAVLVTHGSCLVAAGKHKAVVKEGEGFFIHSGALHGCWDPTHSECRFHSLVFHPRLVGGNMDSIFHHQFILPLLNHSRPELVLLKPDTVWQKDALDAMEAAWQQCVTETPGFPFRVRNALSELIYLLHTHLPSSPATVNSKNQRDSQRIKAMLNFIHRHFNTEVNTAAIAASASISESECLRCFRATIGTTPIQYLKKYRIQQAANLLIQSQEKISDIAVGCGFQDMSYFTKSFRELMGCAPSEYRKNASL